MEKLSSPRLLCKLQRLTCSPVQNKPQASSLRSMLRRQASWLRLDAWLLILCCVQTHHSQTLLPDHTVCLRQDQTVKVFSSEKNDDSIPVILQVIQQTGAPLQALLNPCCTQQDFPETSQTFSSRSFYYPGHSEDWNFLLLSQSCYFLARVFSKAFLVTFWLMAWNLPARGRALNDSEAFNRCIQPINSHFAYVHLLWTLNFLEARA